jgi:hypothetical protein
LPGNASTSAFVHAGRTLTVEAADATWRIYDEDVLVAEVGRTTTKPVARIVAVDEDQRAVISECFLHRDAVRVRLGHDRHCRGADSRAPVLTLPVALPLLEGMAQPPGQNPRHSLVSIRAHAVEHLLRHQTPNGPVVAGQCRHFPSRLVVYPARSNHRLPGAVTDQCQLIRNASD